MLAEATTTQPLVFTRTVPVTPAIAYRAFTTGMGLRDWFCDNALVDAREGGKAWMSWNEGYHVVADFTLLKPDEQIGWNWQGRGDPAPTQVEIKLAAQPGGTHITLTHSGIGQGGAWNGSADMFKQEWEKSLTNLVSILETGLDQRVMSRPMLGIMPGQLDPKFAEKMGIPVKQGIQLSNVLDGMGAKAAGLQKDDVIVSLGGLPAVDFPSLTASVSPHKAGDVVEVEFYRGSSKHTVSMTLSGRPAPDVPPTVAGLAERVEKLQTELNAALDELVKDVSQAEASQAPAPGEWSANEVLAHLIWTERWMQMASWSTLGGEDNVPWPDNNRAHLTPILALYPTLPDLVAELKRAQAGNLAVARSLTDEDVARKSVYLKLGQGWLTFETHTRQHFEQMREAIAAARKA